MDKLAEIMAHKRREIASRVRPVPAAELVRAAAGRPKPPSLASALRRADGRLAVIAEIKRRSPSAGEIKPGVSALEQARRYHAAGAGSHPGGRVRLRRPAAGAERSRGASRP